RFLGEVSADAVARIVERLQAIDPAERLFRTPGDLLPFLEMALAGKGGLKRFEPHTFTAEWLRRRLHPTGEKTPASRWLEAEGPGVVDALVDRAFGNVSVPWPVALTRDEWATYVPKES